jgi:chaperonin GroEL (HSP60 family)
MPQRKGKKLVYVSEDLLEEVAKISRDRGETISKFVEEALKQAVRVNKAGYHPQQLAEYFEVMQAQRVLGGAFIPLEVLNYLTNKACKNEKEQLSAKWYESGKWHGKYLKEKFEDPIQALKIFLEASRWDLNEVEIEKEEEGKVKVRCISTLLTEETTEFLAKFIEGAMHSIGYQTEKNDSMKGMIVFEFKPFPAD